MKVTFFYINTQYQQNQYQDYDTNDLPETTQVSINGSSYSLYGFSADKMETKIFQKTRNMSCFISISKDMNKEQVEELISVIPSFEIRPHPIRSQRINRHNVVVQSMVFILATDKEVNTVRLNKQTFFIEKLDTEFTSNCILLRQDIFQEKYQGILNRIFHMKDFIPTLYPIEEVPFDIIEFDELTVFIEIYREILNEEEVLVCAYTDTIEKMDFRRRKQKRSKREVI